MTWRSYDPNIQGVFKRMKNRSTIPVLKATFGFRAHSGWAAMVVVAGPLEAPRIMDRQRIDLAESRMRDSLQPYHAAAQLDLNEARHLIESCFAIARSMAIRGLESAMDRLGKDGHRLTGCGILLSSGRPVTDLAAVLRSHALIHAAEGDFFREALIEACRHHGLAVTTVPQRDIYTRAATAFGVTQEELRPRVVEWGRGLGPPWTEDQKLAALVACLAFGDK